MKGQFYMLDIAARQKKRPKTEKYGMRGDKCRKLSAALSMIGYLSHAPNPDERGLLCSTYFTAFFKKNLWHLGQ
jgi:hypothetical protein